MNHSQFVATEKTRPWCPHIRHGVLKPYDKTWHYSKGWTVQGVRGRFSSPVPKHWRVCPICGVARPGAEFCKACGQIKPTNKEHSR